MLQCVQSRCNILETTLQTIKCVFNNNPTYAKFKVESDFIRTETATIRVGFHEPISKKYAESPSIIALNSTLPICFSMFIDRKLLFWHSLYKGEFLNILAS